MTFRDMFSERARMYSRYRPDYPEQLFSWICTVTTRHDTVWDCATGNGQAARDLARIFDRVIATDASAEQIANAVPGERIEYRVANASESGLPDASVTMVTVAQALHWLDLDSFYAEVSRVLEPGGALVIWGYADPAMETEALEKIVHNFNRGTIEKYWTPQRQTLLEKYANIPFPFREIATPRLNLERHWTLAELSGYMRTWSATANYVKANGSDPVDAVEAMLAEHWGESERRRLIKWPLHIRAGYSEGR
jgi:ubiquinone/menaquinone biosynthesis C-methylase UbiE